MSRALDERSEGNGSGFEGVRCIVRNADISRCFTDYDQGIETWFY